MTFIIGSLPCPNIPGFAYLNMHAWFFFNSIEYLRIWFTLNLNIAFRISLVKGLQPKPANLIFIIICFIEKNGDVYFCLCRNLINL